MFFQLVPRGLSDLINQNDQISNWKKIIGIKKHAGKVRKKSVLFICYQQQSGIKKQGPSYLLMHVPLKYFFETLVNTSYPSFCYVQRFPGQRHIRSSKADSFHSKISPLFGFSHDLKEAKVQMKTQFSNGLKFCQIAKCALLKSFYTLT